MKLKVSVYNGMVEHFGECEDRVFWECPYCNKLYHDDALNYCTDCSIFIPRVSRCVCQDIADEVNESV